MRTKHLLLLSLIVILATSGCGESRVPVHPVSGKVLFRGQPPVGAQVVLHAVDRGGDHDITPTGVVKEDGTFTVTAYEPGDGAPAGEYVATIQWFKMINDAGASGQGPNVLPQKYAKTESSPILVSVTEGGVKIPSIELSR